eukprot:CAMPEP_0168464204 /NCGR_PEP_ID=MMETSP0228-20121227/55451_1 /TAXON_ID=133427 /ORGANISM="Protoceratium reticulatum, Strain CCCM 535 (=CCMP 1889)" /LENGTH=81 /DNA_ID=CAMNT_0008479685 /DNA_START=54 /DNA_END=295 /DNA_ORIENTATION=+
MASFYKARGSHEKAERLYLEARGIWLRAVGEGHQDYATCLNNLAGLYTAMGDYNRAEAVYKEAQASWARLVGESHPSFATV